MASFTDPRLSSPGGRGRGRETYGRVSCMVSKPLPRQEVVIPLGWSELSPGAELQEFLGRETAGSREEDWKVTCVLFAPHAPEQHPPEDVWLKGKTHLRKQFAVNKTFAQVKRCFSAFLSAFSFDSAKLRWYWPKEQMI